MSDRAANPNAELRTQYTAPSCLFRQFHGDAATGSESVVADVAWNIDRNTASTAPRIPGERPDRAFAVVPYLSAG